MNIFRWLQQSLFLGEVLQDYGYITDERVGIARIRTSVQLCRRSGKLQLVFRNLSTAMLSASIKYWTMDVTPFTLQKLGEILVDANHHLENPGSSKL